VINSLRTVYGGSIRDGTSHREKPIRLGIAFVSFIVTLPPSSITTAINIDVGHKDVNLLYSNIFVSFILYKEYVYCFFPMDIHFLCPHVRNKDLSCSKWNSCKPSFYTVAIRAGSMTTFLRFWTSLRLKLILSQMSHSYSSLFSEPYAWHRFYWWD